ncbi:MAG: DUF885 domain-containing protein [Verrucomicrobia bacterium]|nr:DUF885 domain-containing protein [Verrucomicrobiota bacterium]
MLKKPTLFFLMSIWSASLGCRHMEFKSTQNDWSRFVHGFIEDYFRLHPDAATWAGRHEFDGQLPDWSSQGLDAMIAQLKEARMKANGFGESDLSEKQLFERDYVIARIDGELFWLEEADWPRVNPQFYSNFGGLDPSVYVMRPYASLATRLKAYTAYAKNVPRAVAQIRANLRTPLPKTYIDLGKLLFGGMVSFMEDDIPKVFRTVNDPSSQAEFEIANRDAVKSLRELTAWLESESSKGTDQFAVGAETFSRMLKATERVDVPLDLLEAIGRDDLDRNLAALNAACQALAPGKSVEECIAIVSADKPEGGPVAGARSQLAGLRAFLIEKGLVTIPGTEEALVDESPPFARWNFAYIDIPGAYETGLPSVYYIAPPDPTWSKEEQASYVPGKDDLLFTSVHEVWPGHFLQFLHSNRAQSRFGQVFVGYAFAEGWAHYAEEMMWEAGLGAGDPSTHIGQLLNALLRNVRFLSAIGLHTGKMTVADSEKMFREMAYQDPGNARQQAARGTFDPAYLNYTLGKLMIRKLREDWSSTRGGRSAWRAFHDQFLSYGGPPIPLIRRAMLGPDSGSAL